MKQQKVVRTYPKNFMNPTRTLEQSLASGWVVIMSNKFECGNGQEGTEYILEKTTN